jgi:hypothetical protein
MKQERIVWIVIFIIGLVVRCTELFHPVSTVSWRESDMSSIARNYCRNGMDFFHPQVDWGGEGPGYTESEFPVYPYLIALSQKIIGNWEPIGRIISFLFSLGTIIIFFRLSKYLFNIKEAMVASFFFSLSPLLMITSNSIQPESVMFFFYIFAVFQFIRCVDSHFGKYYFSTIILTSLALLCKITAINIGILFILIIIINKGWRFLFKPKVILLGVLSIMPSIIWYTYSHRFYTQYGNSLGLSNEYAWVGLDFFTNSYFIKGIIKQELIHVWTYSGAVIFLLALVSTKIIKKRSIIFPACWLVAVAIFYFIASRTTADIWAYYYHIFSVPTASMILGISVTEVYDKYSPMMKLNWKTSASILDFIKSRLIISALILLVFFYLAFNFRYLIRTKYNVFKTSEYYECRDRLSNLIPRGSLILVSGGICSDGKYPVAYNASYFFYWLDRKGYSICVDDQSIESVLAFKAKGAVFYIAETQSMEQKQRFEGLMRNRFNVIFECNGIILFKL